MAEVLSRRIVRIFKVPSRMRGMAAFAGTLEEEANRETTNHNLKSILGDHLVRNTGEKVRIADMSMKTIALYFTKHALGACERFMLALRDVYQKIKNDCEVVYVPGNYDEQSFESYFSCMPWLAVPCSNLEIRHQLSMLCKEEGGLRLVMLDGNGMVLSGKGQEFIRDYGLEAYPFTPEKIIQINEMEEAARRNASLSTLLGTNSRDYLISRERNELPISDIKAKIVALYFCNSSNACQEFTRKLVEIYEKLKAIGENFEAVLIFSGIDEQAYNEVLESIPFLAIPFMDMIIDKLSINFSPWQYPMLVIIGPDGKTLNLEAADLVDEYGILAYPFTPAKVQELADMERRKLESLTLESLLVSEKSDFVIRYGGEKVPVSDLVGKPTLLYFGFHGSWDPDVLLAMLIKAYYEIKARVANFEIIFISNDEDQNAFDDYFSKMPWLALPFGDQRKNTLDHMLHIWTTPCIKVFGPTGMMITGNARELLMFHGPVAYPFTKEHVKELEAKIKEKAKGWPKEIKHPLHAKHELKLTRSKEPFYHCRKCNVTGGGGGWSYYCKKCKFRLHIRCALEEDDEKRETLGDGH